MSKLLAQNIYRMHNPEIIGLAKNRFLPANVQLAIAKHHYRRAHTYLAENEGLSPETRDYLWSEECNKGYSLKATMIQCGQYAQEPDKYWELYEKYPGAWTRSGWRMTQAFFGGYWYRTSPDRPAAPTDLLNKIYDDRFSSLRRTEPSAHSYYYGSHPKYQLERLAAHPNVDLPLAIKLSQCGIDSVQKLGFKKIVELS